MKLRKALPSLLLFSVLIASSVFSQIPPPKPMSEYVKWASLDKFIADAGGTFDTSVFNTAIASCEANAWGTLYIPAGRYEFTSIPNKLDYNITLRGSGTATTVLVKKFSGGPFLEFTGVKSNLSGIHDLSLYAETGTPGVGVKLSSNGTVAASGMSLTNLKITGPAQWTFALHLDGSQNINGAVGVRATYLGNPEFSDCTIASIFGHSVEGLFIDGGRFSGYAPQASIHFDGWPAIRSNYLHIEAQMDGQLNIKNTGEVYFNGSYGWLNSDVNSFPVWVAGFKTNTPADVWGGFGKVDSIASYYPGRPSY